jgi:hypothetical protein
VRGLRRHLDRLQRPVRRSRPPHVDAAGECTRTFSYEDADATRIRTAI